MNDTKERAPRGLRFKLFTYFLLFSLIIVMLLWVFQILFLDRFYDAITDARLKKAAEEIAEAVKGDGLYETAERASRENGACVNVYSIEDLQAVCLCSVDAEVACVIHILSQRQLNTLYKSTYASGGSYSNAYRLIEGDGFRFADEKAEIAEGDRKSHTSELQSR